MMVDAKGDGDTQKPSVAWSSKVSSVKGGRKKEKEKKNERD